MVPSAPASLRPGLELGKDGPVHQPKPKHAARYGCEQRAGFYRATNLGRAASAHGSSKHPVRSRGSAASVAQSGFLCRAGGVLRRDSTPTARPGGRRNALDIQLVAHSISFPDLPRAFDGYRILHLSDTHLDCLPELAAVASRLITGIEVDLLALTGDIHGRQRAPLADSTGPLAELIGAVRVKIAVWRFLAITIPRLWPRLSRI